jgi:hypothetical protein
MGVTKQSWYSNNSFLRLLVAETKNKEEKRKKK